MRLVLYRHGESSNNKKDHHDTVEGGKEKKGREPDPDLTPKGHKQAEVSAPFLASHFQFSLVLVSPMRRALQTAAPLKRYLEDTEIRIDTEIFEQGGLFKGERKEQGKGKEHVFGPSVKLAAEIVGARVDEECEEKGWWRGGYEQPDQTRSRAKRVKEKLFEIEKQSKNRDVLLVTHGLFIDYLMKEMLSSDFPVLMTGNCAISVIKIQEARVGIEFLNSIWHLPQKLQTGHSINGFTFQPLVENKEQGEYQVKKKLKL
eukprot:Lithocolla_globosa_v1_NODE_599_length_3623_cov_13.493554.p2 type:complete len:259 gc:universal NODE_599_length_3623_cov_13.493554:2124-1348(-)